MRARLILQFEADKTRREIGLHAIRYSIAPDGIGLGTAETMVLEDYDLRYNIDWAESVSSEEITQKIVDLVSEVLPPNT